MGFGAEIAAVVQERAFDYLDAPIERVGAKFAPLPFAPVMEEFVVPHKADVLAAVKRTVGERAEWPSQVTLPRLGQGMESGTIVRWLKSEGDPVEKGEPLYELDTEKVTQEVEADAAGVLLKILAGEGEEIEVGKADRRDRRGRGGGPDRSRRREDRHEPKAEEAGGGAEREEPARARREAGTPRAPAPSRAPSRAAAAETAGA